MMIGYFQAPNLIFDNAALTIYQKMVLFYLCRAGNNGASAYPSYKTIAQKCAMSLSKAKETVKKLESMGVLVVWRRREDKWHNKTNIYTINLQAVPIMVSDVGPNRECADMDGVSQTPHSPQNTPHSPQENRGVVHDIDPIKNHTNKNQYKEPDIKNHSLGCAASPCSGAISFDEYKNQYQKDKDPDAIQAVELFIDYRKSVYGEHKPMSVQSWDEAVDKALVFYIMHDDEYQGGSEEIDLFRAMVELYFQKKYADGCDYSIAHFNSPRLKAILAHEVS